MTWFVTTLVVVLVVLTTAAVLGRVDGALAEPTSTHGHDPLPDEPLTGADLDELRFDTAFRGYHMGQVDRVVERLRRELEALQGEVAQLRTPSPSVSPPDHDSGPVPVPDAYARPDADPVRAERTGH